jgi:GNAT superfamily N-acetyltransferase
MWTLEVGPYQPATDREAVEGIWEAQHMNYPWLGGVLDGTDPRARLLVGRPQGEEKPVVTLVEGAVGPHMLSNLVAHPDYRGTGVGRPMLRRAEQDIRALGHASVELQANVDTWDPGDSTALHGWYEKQYGKPTYGVAGYEKLIKNPLTTVDAQLEWGFPLVYQQARRQDRLARLCLHAVGNIHDALLTGPPELFAFASSVREGARTTKSCAFLDDHITMALKDKKKSWGIVDRLTDWLPLAVPLQSGVQALCYLTGSDMAPARPGISYPVPFQTTYMVRIKQSGVILLFDVMLQSSEHNYDIDIVTLWRPQNISTVRRTAYLNFIATARRVHLNRISRAKIGAPKRAHRSV